MKTTIFIKTHSRDAAYHEYCIKSCLKFCSGFEGPVVVHSEEQPGYLLQQYYKMTADLYCPGADYILVTDSDTLFTEPVTPESFMRDGKPIWFYTPFEGVLSQDKNVQCWIEVMEKFIGQRPDSEKMRRQPFMFPSWILPKFRQFCIEKHGKDLRRYILDSGRFSEWNCLGSFAWLYHHDAFSWINTDEELPPAKCLQAWSHTPIAENRERFEKILA